MTELYRHPCRLIILAACLAVCAQAAAAQDVSDELDELDIVQPTARGCLRNGINIANLSALLATTKERAFVVARLGTGENSRRLNRRRLNNVKTRLGRNKGTEKVILAEGERVKGRGRVEFYLGSEIHFISMMARNGDFCSPCAYQREALCEDISGARVNVKRRR